jgi:tetratricopeptide (TPR) repeat protein
MPPLEMPDQYHLNAAEGWLGLGDVDSALQELEQIPPPGRGHPAVLLVQCRIHIAAKNWEILIQTAEQIIQDFPGLHEAWVDRSYGLHELKRTQAAFDALLPASGLFPRVWVIPYNLSCYCAQTGQLREALEWLESAIVLGGEHDIRSQALQDPDLKPLWKQIRPDTITP